MTVTIVNQACREEAHCSDTRVYAYTYHGVLPGDVLYTNVATGTWNVSKFERLLIEDFNRFTAIEALLDETIAKYVSEQVETDPKVIAALTPERLEYPLYGVWFPDTDTGDLTVMIIDGHHRLMRLWADKVTVVKAIMLKYEYNDLIRVKRTKEPI
jgi:hypothetical protein